MMVLRSHNGVVMKALALSIQSSCGHFHIFLDKFQDGFSCLCELICLSQMSDFVDIDSELKFIAPEAPRGLIFAIAFLALVPAALPPLQVLLFVLFPFLWSIFRMKVLFCGNAETVQIQDHWNASKHLGFLQRVRSHLFIGADWLIPFCTHDASWCVDIQIPSHPGSLYILVLSRNRSQCSSHTDPLWCQIRAVCKISSRMISNFCILRASIPIRLLSIDIKYTLKFLVPESFASVTAQCWFDGRLLGAKTCTFPTDLARHFQKSSNVVHHWTTKMVTSAPLLCPNLALILSPCRIGRTLTLPFPSHPALTKIAIKKSNSPTNGLQPKESTTSPKWLATIATNSIQNTLLKLSLSLKTPLLTLVSIVPPDPRVSTLQIFWEQGQIWNSNTLRFGCRKLKTLIIPEGGCLEKLLRKRSQV